MDYSFLCNILTKITICKIYRCREIQNTHHSPFFRYETFINFLSLVFRHEERETQFLLCWLFLHHPHPTPSWTAQPRVKISTHFWTARPRVKISTHFWTARPRVKISTNIFFEITKFPPHCFRAWHHSHPSPIFYPGFLLWHLWLPYPLCTSVNCTQCVHLHLQKAE